MGGISFEDLQFNKYSGEKLPGYFQYNIEDIDLVNFYTEDAKRLQEESIVHLYNILLDKKMVGYFAFCPSEIKINALRKEDKVAPFSHPALKLGRLLVCKSTRGLGVGKHALFFLTTIASKLKEDLPIRFIILDSVPQSVGFYTKNGFTDSGIKTGRERSQSLLYMDINKT